MEGFGPLLILIGCFILMNTFAKMKRKKYTFADKYKSTKAPRNKRTDSNGFREPRRK